MDGRATEAQKYVWGGAIPLQIHLHESEVTTLPPPPPALILAPRLGYLPLLVPHIKPFFSSALPPGVDTVWFEYKGLPLKWHVPTGVLFDLLCAEPERPWNLTVHFRGYPGNILIPWEGEDSVKWSFINSLKEAAYIMNGNCKNVMNMSQSDQLELWRSVLDGNLEAYVKVSSKLKLGIVADDFLVTLSSSKSVQRAIDVDGTGLPKAGRFPVRLYVRSLNVDSDDLKDLPYVESWDKIFYINRPVQIIEEGEYFSLRDAIKFLLPEYFGTNSIDGNDTYATISNEVSSGTAETTASAEEVEQVPHDGEKSSCRTGNAEIVHVRVQGIQPKLDIPLAWLISNLMNPDYFLHICVYIRVPEAVSAL